MLLIRLLTFALGGAVAIALRQRLQWSMTAVVVAGALVYVATDLVLEALLFST